MDIVEIGHSIALAPFCFAGIFNKRNSAISLTLLTRIWLDTDGYCSLKGYLSNWSAIGML